VTIELGHKVCHSLMEFALDLSFCREDSPRPGLQASSRVVGDESESCV